MQKIILLILVSLSLNVNAQDTLTSKCWTPEMDTTDFYNLSWYSNNNFLENFLDSIGYPANGAASRIIGQPQVRFWIPITFWVYRRDDGTGGPTLRQLRLLMDDLNRRYNQVNNTQIGFYMKCNPIFQNNTSNFTKTFAGASILMALNNDLGSINVHVIGNFASPGTAGFALAPLNACMIPSASYSVPTANGDLAHEVGMYLV